MLPFVVSGSVRVLFRQYPCWDVHCYKFRDIVLRDLAAHWLLQGYVGLTIPDVRFCCSARRKHSAAVYRVGCGGGPDEGPR